MDKAILRTLDEGTRARIAETAPERLRRLDEDALCELHTRVRRQRNKYTKLYRRRSSKQVVKSASRGIARPKDPRTDAKVELYEDALARVSEALAAAARISAARLSAQRLRKARATSTAARPKAARRGAARGGSRVSPANRPIRAKSPAPIARKRVASVRAKGARRQAQRDSR